MVSKKRLILLAAGVTSAVMFAAFVPGSASAETNRRLCGAKVTRADGTAVAYVVAKVSKKDHSACDEAINFDAADSLAGQIKTRGIPGLGEGDLTSNVTLATCESVFADLGFPPGTDQCPFIEVSPDPENIIALFIGRGEGV